MSSKNSPAGPQYKIDQSGEAWILKRLCAGNWQSIAQVSPDENGDYFAESIDDTVRHIHGLSIKETEPVIDYLWDNREYFWQLSKHNQEGEHEQH